MTKPFLTRSRTLARRLAAALGAVTLAVVLSGCTTQRTAQRVPEARPAPQATAPRIEPPVVTEPAPITLPGEMVSTGKARVALLLPLSGANAPLGRAMLNAASLALFAADSDTVELLPRDTEGIGGAYGATVDALNDGAELILGPIFSASIADVANAARQRGVPVISFSNDAAAAGNGVYVIGFTPENQIQRVATFAQSRGAQRFAALVPDNAFGSRAADALRKVVEGAGGHVTRVSRYSSMETQALSAVVRQLADYDQRRAALRAQRAALAGKSDEASRAALRRLDGVETTGDPDFDALLIPEGGARLRAIAPLLSFYDIDTRRVRLLGTFDWNDPLTETEPSLNGGWYPAPPPDARSQFESEYQKTFSAAPPRIASLAFDATLLAAVIARSTDSRPRYTAERLTQPNGFAGADGIFRLTPEGAVERGLAVVEVRLRASRIVSPAPTTFNPPSN